MYSRLALCCPTQKLLRYCSYQLNSSAWRRFAERHRRLVNVLIQQNVQLLLEGPLTQLMRAPRLIDFDNKRLFFRNQVRSSSDRYHGSLRIHVRREHLFEDSFHQLRSKCALLPFCMCSIC